MAARFITIDRDTPMLLPPDMRDWVPADDMVHFIIQAVEGMHLPALKVNTRGTGSKTYPPKMMLALLIYCYANGIFSSRRIERATYRDIGVRYLTAGTHPDHDTICTFRRENFEVFSEAFLQLLLLARELGVLKVGTVSVDGTHIQANASLKRNAQYDRAVELEAQLRQEIADRMAEAERIDQSEDTDGQSLPKSITSREQLRTKLTEAMAQLKAQAAARAAKEQAEFEVKCKARAQAKAEGKRIGGRALKPPGPDAADPKPGDRINLTDPDSRAMRKNHRASYQQAYNAQAAVDADGSMLVLSSHVTTKPADFGELDVAVDGIDPSVGEVKQVLADGGYAKCESIETLEARGMDVYVAVSADTNLDVHPHDLSQSPGKPRASRPLKQATMKRMDAKVRSEEGRRVYGKRKTSVEPVFGIIKSVMGFDRFLLRGLDRVTGEWSLVTLSYNFKRLHRMCNAG